jgi:hypothetical protein
MEETVNLLDAMIKASKKYHYPDTYHTLSTVKKTIKKRQQRALSH